LAPAAARRSAARAAAATRGAPAPVPAATATTAALRSVLARLVLREKDVLGQKFLRDAAARDLVADVLLDFRQADRVVLAGEADGIALGTGARGAADAVHVVRAVLRQVVVVHVADVRHVQSARGHV